MLIMLFEYLHTWFVSLYALMPLQVQLSTQTTCQFCPTSFPYFHLFFFSSISLYHLRWHLSQAHTAPLACLNYSSFLSISYIPNTYFFFSIFSHLSGKIPLPTPSLPPSLFPQSHSYGISGMGPINPASLCLISPPLIRMHTGDILLLLVVGDWHSHLSNS